MRRELMHSKSRNSTELVPLWKVYGFLQSDGDAAKDIMGLHQQMKQKEMFCIHTNQVSPYKWPSTSLQNDKKCDNQTKTETVQQISWNKRLMHRTRSAMM